MIKLLLKGQEIQMPRALDILTASQAKIPLMAEGKSIYSPERIKGNPKLPATNVKFL